MGLITKTVEVGLGGSNIKHYEKLGYTIPVKTNKKGKLIYDKDSKITVKTQHLPNKSAVCVDVKCDMCNKILKNVVWYVYQKCVKQDSYICIHCVRKNNIFRKFTKQDLDNIVKTNMSNFKIINIKTKKNITIIDLSDEYGYIYENIKPTKIKNKYKPSPFIIRGENTYSIIKNINNWCNINNKSFKTLDKEYKSATFKMKWKCLKEDCGEIFESSWSQIYNQNQGCAYCCGRYATEKNNLYIRFPKIASEWNFDKNDKHPKDYLPFSSQKVHWICSCCGNKYEQYIDCRTKRNNGCQNCGDGISYPEKIMSNVLNQLNLKFEHQLTSKKMRWCDNYKYDFYLNDYNIIIETHGSQHYKESGRGRTLLKEKQNDEDKKELAFKNGIQKNNYIIINCSISDLNYIKLNIIQSNLSKLFELSNINWEKCHEYACSSLVKIACDLWEGGIKNTVEIGDILNLSYSTIGSYLKQGKLLGWCNYNPKQAMAKNYKQSILKTQKSIICLNTGEIFESMSKAKCRYNSFNIWSCCNGKYNSAGKHPETGEPLKWMYYEDYIAQQENNKNEANIINT